MHEAVIAELARWSKLIGSADSYDTDNTVGIHDVMRCHFALANHFYDIGFGVGGLGPRDLSLLESAVGRQFAGFGGRDKWSEAEELVATLMYGLIKNHPFHDINKRTAFLVSLLHLRKLGRTNQATQEEYEQFTIDVADGSIELYDGYGDYDGQEDQCVRFMAHWIRRRTRAIDNRTKLITYNELNTILKRFGYELKYPNGNAIEIRMRIGDKRITTVGFHGWSREVAKGVLRDVRKHTELNEENGIDSEVFFNDEQNMYELIRDYEAPLRRLAYK